MKSRWLASLSFVALAATGGPAFAQDSGDIAESNEIVVTAQKREEKLREVPISISAITGDTMQRLGATRFSDVAGYIPGMNYQGSNSGSPGEGRFNLRGVSSTSAAATTAIYVDDVPTTAHGVYGSAEFKVVDLSPYDVERVEVLRGPQGTLYGDSTIGGLVKYVTRAADVDHFSGVTGVEAIAIDGGEGIGLGARGAVNVPIASGVFGVRVSGFYQEVPGFQANVATGEKATNRVKQRGLRVAARLRPSADFTIDAQWLHNEFESSDRAMTRLVPGTTQPFYGDYINFSPIGQPSSQKFDLGSLTARYDFGSVNLTSVSAYSKVKRDFNADYTFFVRGFITQLTGGAVTDGIGLFSNPNNTEKYTQELRLASAQDQRLSWLIGGYYTAENTKLQSLTLPFFANGEPITNLPDIYRFRVKARYIDKSLFANVNYKITDKWDVSGGIRQSWITDKFENHAVGVRVGGETSDSSKATNSAMTWSLGTRYVASDDLMMFARVATGFRAGSTNSTWPGVPRGFGPDSMTSYEAGARANFLDNLASVDLTVYYLDWTDLFINARTPDGITYTTNGGKANGPGMEFTGTLRPLRNLSLIATAGYFGLKIREDLPTINAAAGDRPPASPAWSGSLLANYAVPLGSDWSLNLSGGARWAGHSWSEFRHNPTARRIPSFVVGDLNASVSNDSWTLRAYVRNLTNEHKLVAIGLDNRGVLMVPRTFGLALDVKF